MENNNKEPEGKFPSLSKLGAGFAIGVGVGVALGVT